MILRESKWRYKNRLYKIVFGIILLFKSRDSRLLERYSRQNSLFFSGLHESQRTISSVKKKLLQQQRIYFQVSCWKFTFVLLPKNNRKKLDKQQKKSLASATEIGNIYKPRIIGTRGFPISTAFFRARIKAEKNTWKSGIVRIRCCSRNTSWATVLAYLDSRLSPTQENVPR